MRYRLFCVVIVLFLGTFSPIRGQDHSCTDSFQPIKTIQPEVNPNQLSSEDYGSVMTWYTDSQCVLIGSTSGLWMVDIDHPDKPLMLASVADKAIGNVAVNPADGSIAFNAAQQPVVYIMNIDGTTSTLRAGGQSVTAIAFSPDGTLISVASSDFDEDGGFFKNGRVQIWNWKTQIQLSSLAIDLKDKIHSYVLSMFFTADNLHLLTEIAPGEYDGYDSYRVDYWDIASQLLIWDYDELDFKLQRSAYDPLHVETAVMRGTNLALAGLDVYFGPTDFKGDGIRIWDVEHQMRLAEIVVDESDIRLAAIAFDSDGAILVVAKDDGVIQLLKMPDGSKLAEFNVGSTSVQHISYSPDDRYLAVQTDNKIIIWDVQQAKAYTSIPLPQQTPIS